MSLVRADIGPEIVNQYITCKLLILSLYFIPECATVLFSKGPPLPSMTISGENDT